MTSHRGSACDKAGPVAPGADNGTQKRKNNRHLPHCGNFRRRPVAALTAL
jgi:hypothetical protein